MVTIAIVRSVFNEEITAKMLKAARAYARKRGIRIAAEARVPGAFDMPLVIKKLLERKDVQGVATLGAVIKGETKHDEVIAYQVAHAITKLSLRYDKPIGLGIIGPGVNRDQADKRAVEYAERAVEAAASVHEELKKI